MKLMRLNEIVGRETTKQVEARGKLKRSAFK